MTRARQRADRAPHLLCWDHPGYLAGPIPRPSAGLGSNRQGAMLGGCLGYLSIGTGLRALVVLTALL